MGNQESKSYDFFNPEPAGWFFVGWLFLFMIVQLTIVFLAASRGADLINRDNLEVITIVITSILILYLIPKFLKYSNLKMKETLNDYNIKIEEEDIAEIKKNTKMKRVLFRIISFALYSIIMIYMIVIDHYWMFKNTELDIETKLTNMFVEVTFTTEINIFLGVFLYVVYLLLFLTFFTYLYIITVTFLEKLSLIFEPLFTTQNKELDLFNGDNKMGLEKLGTIGNRIIIICLIVFLMSFPSVFLSYFEIIPSSSFLYVLLIWVFIFSLAWLNYVYQSFKPFNKMMKLRKVQELGKITNDIGEEFKKFQLNQSNNLSTLLELRKQIMEIDTWPFSSRFFTLLVSQVLIIIVAIISWLITFFGNQNVF